MEFLVFFQAMKKRNGNTNTSGVLQQAMATLQKGGRPDSQKYVYLFTDGAPDNQPLAVNAANMLRAATV